jgi:hypothetical protein
LEFHFYSAQEKKLRIIVENIEYTSQTQGRRKHKIASIPTNPPMVIGMWNLDFQVSLSDFLGGCLGAGFLGLATGFIAGSGSSSDS